MDYLVATYSQPEYQDEVYSDHEQQELAQAVPPLSLRFALPPVAQVRFSQIRNFGYGNH